MTAAENNGVTFELGPRQIAAGLFLVVILVGLSAAAAYLAGRSVWAAHSRRASPNPTVAADTSQTSAASPASAAAPAAVASSATATSPAPVAALAHPKGAQPASFFCVPEPGQVFLQVAAVDRGPAEVFAEYLTRQGFSTQVADGPDSRSYRVLVGPVVDDSQIEPLRARLEAAGFQPFVQRYR